jgi:AcrR family transcriptional regulator
MTREANGGDASKRARREERRAQLLEAAIAAIREIGPGATMEQLSAAGGVTKPIVYRHFGHRDGLVRAIGERFATELLEQVQASLTSDADPRDLLRSTVDAYLAFVERDTNLYRFLMQHSARDEGSFEHRGLAAEVSRQVALVIGEQLRAFNLDSGPAEPWAHGIVGMVHQAGDWWLENRSMPRSTLVEYLTSLLFDGFAHQAVLHAERTGT